MQRMILIIFYFVFSCINSNNILAQKNGTNQNRKLISKYMHCKDIIKEHEDLLSNYEKNNKLIKYLEGEIIDSIKSRENKLEIYYLQERNKNMHNQLIIIERRQTILIQNISKEIDLYKNLINKDSVLMLKTLDFIDFVSPHSAQINNIRSQLKKPSPSKKTYYVLSVIISFIIIIIIYKNYKTK